MRGVLRSFLSLTCLAVLAGALALSVAGTAPLEAQCKPGEFVLRQGGTVGWVYVTGDQSSEWWAYIEGEYEWASSSSVGTSAWQAEAEYIGAGPWNSYSAWKADVLERAAAQGRTITFEQHALIVESVEN